MKKALVTGITGQDSFFLAERDKARRALICGVSGQDGTYLVVNNTLTPFRDISHGEVL